MTANAAGAIEKYQGVVPNRVIAAVQKAAARTGADFSYLMEKASAESGFDAKATSTKSTATGLFQFIESTWLGMVKQYGDKFGLGHLASQIEIKNGRPCVDDCTVKDKILDLRKNPEISALMAGAYSKQNEAYLAAHTDGPVSDADLCLAHFMGAGGAAKFLNARAADGGAIAAKLFPREAHVNKNVFYDRTTHQPRTLDQIYDMFAKKFDSDAATPSSAPSAEEPSSAKAEAAVFRAPAPSAAPSRIAVQAPHFQSRLSSATMMAMADMQQHLFSTHNTHKDRYGYNA